MKSATAFRTISEVSAELAVPQHVLRFWETKFPQIRPLKRGGGRRYYRPEDVDLLRRIQNLLYKEGYTIRGVQRVLREPRAGRPATAEGDGDPASRDALEVSLDGAPEDGGEEAQPGIAGLDEEGADEFPDEGEVPVPSPAPGALGLSDPARREIEAVIRELRALDALLKRARSS